MGHELICSWLGLPSATWPPDHYLLLDLKPGEGDVQLIEQRVHQRLDLVRRYQMMHPEQATEAMNRLAQAFVCLTEPTAKARYDRELLGARPTPPPLPPPPIRINRAGVPEVPPPALDPLGYLYAPQPTTALAEPPPLPRDPAASDSGFNPPPIRIPPPLPPQSGDSIVAGEAEAVEPEESPPPSPPPVEPAEPVDPVEEAARSKAACVGLCSRKGLYHRAILTRRLQRLWRKLGRYLAEHQRKLGKQEAGELIRVLEEIDSLLEDFPPPLGEAGQPGYMTLALTQMDNPRSTILTLSVNQRESLARDWKAGRKFLQAHRQCLLAHLQAMRRLSWPGRKMVAVRGFLNERPGYALLLVLGLSAVAAALWRAFWPG